uniref:Uncharacterized protein n=1 Tax=Trichobilharzia regenti TaxID=157069 RepID=A0AA85JJI1_TRIRE|nr:unnamed protein product [Trichobilharzia regenti]
MGIYQEVLKELITTYCMENESTSTETIQLLQAIRQMYIDRATRLHFHCVEPGHTVVCMIIAHFMDIHIHLLGVRKSIFTMTLYTEDITSREDLSYIVVENLFHQLLLSEYYSIL